jgi:hypothetical protein
MVLPFLPPPTILLLPGNESITLPCKPLQLPPILPPILSPIQGPRTPRTLRRIPINELLGTPHTPVRRITKKGKTESTRDDRLRVQTYHDAGLGCGQIMDKTGLSQNQVYYALNY